MSNPAQDAGRLPHGQPVHFFPVLLVDGELHDDTPAGRATRALVDHMRGGGTQVITATEARDTERIIAETPSLSGLVLDWDSGHTPDDTAPAPGGSPDGESDVAWSATATETLLHEVRASKPTMPIFLLADRSVVEELQLELLLLVNGYIRKLDDAPSSVARRVEKARCEYLGRLLPAL